MKVDVTELTIKSASDLLAKKQIKAKELTEAFLKRAYGLNKKLNCYITISADVAQKQAEKVDKLIADNQPVGPTLGIPIAVKDMFTTRGIKTTAASRVLENYMPVYDATVISRLKEANTIFIGKTNQDAWAHGASGENSDFGPTKNPYDLIRVPGGSSSGSAAALAASTCLAATGTDTGGSIRQPAAFCNLVGLKPTYGRVSRYGIIAMASSLDAIGHFTKTVYDNALILSATAGPDSFDATCVQGAASDYTQGIHGGVKGLKIGLPREYYENLDEKIKKTILTAVKKLEGLGAKIEEVSLPHTEYGVATYYIIQPSEVSANLARYDGIRFGRDRSKFGAEAKRRIILGTYALSAGYYDAFYLKAMKVRRLIREDFLKVFRGVDVTICPTSPTLPFCLGQKVNDPLAMYLSDIYTVTANLVGVPSLNIPCGFIGHLPVGMQIIGPDFSEKLLYQVGYAYEQETKWYERKPSLA
ncbi:glutaminyl-tRNA synthase (glutamine-hydrolyzing) subunit A [Candidatus Curtissbacteria bacterium RIFCSPHIGHO2_01_FULL_41_44]|uniref:Glutamyl-tRNA(Gln) amidotransferase subunit A n=1 Tax=Candidatus Curtissbacteria bacterium RIFCSPLOWO2_01_FULL_42_50 TaxID=1797730 RepID=A0A1F5H471_9BACT|nr:MAG: glutaminyl-tRNA synthase (glutamine-hydrolyzing) subunit A [Candidatus Curtissbacteria bacterium RIFCSPHIGHO2_01_FULL_41_44]OGD93268.1 MAG: glutaminyl-tRNA synthase (glutamine-hydrolyzing) subunit A [Candidatus Curtissbacteria bacterium RIFCSPHIGHO2_02_FULL_42_58]OGD96908.1 MAG: glutaminyl-tRNA synthase (glutamine-hydrolyzing) subunit A [Candidatus Curtissbacteria bacterium RIFCSPHIGHO2_12_FULL_42_33]OGD98972.1 MAG: glutaminyl-tRNA synthase (glutamine-hydrolyzing) subunit A [Candidatus C